VIPLRPADRAEQHGVGGAAGGFRFRRQGLAGGVDGAAADEVLLDGELCGRNRRRQRRGQLAAAPVTSGPMPSPGRKTSWLP
jgi:hypothetical protein